MLAALLPLLPVLVLAQAAPATPSASDVPRLRLESGKTVRLNTNGLVREAEVRSLLKDVLVVRLPEGRLESVPLAALDQVEVRETRTAVGAARGSLVGALTLGLLSAALCGLGCDEKAAIVWWSTLGALTGAAMGGAMGAVVGSQTPSWRPVYTRPGVRFPEAAR